MRKHRLLCELAWKMQGEASDGEGGAETGAGSDTSVKPLGVVVQQEQLEQVVLKHVRMIDGLVCPPAFVARQVIDQLRKRDGILQWLGGTSYAFVHRSFLEYFCASYYHHKWMADKKVQQLQHLFRERGQDGELGSGADAAVWHGRHG